MAKHPVDQNPSSPDDDLLNVLFADARKDAETELSPYFEARLLVQASQVQNGLLRQMAEDARPLWRRVWDELGGWPTVTGLATATVAGLWIGGVSPTVLDTVWEGVGVRTVSEGSFFPDYDALFEEI